MGNGAQVLGSPIKALDAPRQAPPWMSSQMGRHWILRVAVVIYGFGAIANAWAVLRVGRVDDYSWLAVGAL